VVTREAFTEAGSEETAHLLRSPKNAERLLQTLARSEGGEGIPMTIEELRAAVGFDETENDEEEKRR
jgi:antitoxin YefM